MPARRFNPFDPFDYGDHDLADDDPDDPDGPVAGDDDDQIDRRFQRRIDWLEREVGDLRKTVARSYWSLALLAGILLAHILFSVALACRQNGWL